ncbi:DUF6241 domain-containing protein [Sporosarcina sp. A2]|uniref:DUF6241 domain-containing protein n=1 Tax=Sporosarcina sp. A2 TaxID=3393449 RepID=UPI003D7BAD3D
MKKKIGLITIVGIVVLLGIGLFLAQSLRDTKDSLDRPASSKQDSIVHTIDEHDKKPAEQEFPDTLSEYDLQEAIHAMSHQKVKASPKWTSILMTPERIDRLLQLVNENEERYKKNHSLYVEILQRWSLEDFSIVDQDHNAIWNLQNGTIGQATGILTDEEESAFIRDRLKLNKSKDK